MPTARPERVDQFTAALLDAFFASQTEIPARSFNNLVGIVGCFLNWAVSQDRLSASPLRTARRRETDQPVPFLFDPPRPGSSWRPRRFRTTREPKAGVRPITSSSPSAMGWDCERARPAAFESATSTRDRQLLVVRGGKFGKSRLVPHGPRIGELLARQVERCGGSSEEPLFSFAAQRQCRTLGPRARSSIG